MAYAYVNSFTTNQGLGQMPYLERIQFIVNRVTSFDFSGASSLTTLYLSSNNPSPTVIDLSPCPLLTFVSISANPNLTTVINTNGYASVSFMTAAGCALPSEVVDEILIALSTNGISGGNCFLDGGTNGAPTSAGLSAAAALSANGWSVTHN